MTDPRRGATRCASCEAARWWPRAPRAPPSAASPPTTRCGLRQVIVIVLLDNSQLIRCSWHAVLAGHGHMCGCPAGLPRMWWPCTTGYLDVWHLGLICWHRSASSTSVELAKSNLQGPKPTSSAWMTFDQFTSPSKGFDPTETGRTENNRPNRLGRSSSRASRDAKLPRPARAIPEVIILGETMMLRRTGCSGG